MVVKMPQQMLLWQLPWLMRAWWEPLVRWYRRVPPSSW
jgi:hypothetical protein